MKIKELKNLIENNKEKFDLYYQTLVSYNEKVNLTAITDQNEVYTKHFLDSILPIEEIKNNASVVDVGTGAGFPGVPIKIVRPDINITLVDSLQKRINFLDLLCSELKIKSTNIHFRAEEFATKNREKFDVATARAVAKLNTLLEYLLPLVKVGGYVLAYKGSSAEDELAEAKNAISILGGEYQKTLNYELPNNAGSRNIIIIKKVKPTPKQFPRGQNKPKTNPIN